jgi:hypothetical protein
VRDWGMSHGLQNSVASVRRRRRPIPKVKLSRALGVLVGVSQEIGLTMLATKSLRVQTIDALSLVAAPATERKSSGRQRRLIRAAFLASNGEIRTSELNSCSYEGA